MRSTQLRRSLLAVSCAGTLYLTGCLAAFERSIDFIFAPEAVGNLLSVPYSGVGGLAQFFSTFFRM